MCLRTIVWVYLIVYAQFGFGQRLGTDLLVYLRPSDRYPDTEHLFAPATSRQVAEDIWHLRYPDVRSADAAHRRLLESRHVVAVQYNYRLQFRANPNDSEYGRQAPNFSRAGFEAVWERTTGGDTPAGTPIVTAVLDSGFDIDHADLLPNLWRNPGEVPDDGVDNDGNGLVDDVHGWDFTSESGNFAVTTHGTSVAGLLGARGNNGVGVTGTNWDARMMLFGIETVADVVAAYTYVLDQRTEFNQSGGARGAFVVATNASFGIEGATCADFPVWGEMYDRLGRAGILTAASVVNVDRDVEEFGDMPVDCPSDFLIGVTNIDEFDRRFPSAGFGRFSVDLAAPGEGSFTTLPGDRYGSFGSTSAAAPYVTGAISLLYALDCDRLHEQSLSDPPAAALRIRSAVLGSVRNSEALINITATGGVIDVEAAAERLLRDCVPAARQSRLVAYPNPTATEVTLRTDVDEFAGALRLRLYAANGTRIVPVGGVTGSTFPAAVVLDVRGLPAGLYVAELRDAERSWQTTVVIL